jgi:hypothetical protein
MFQTNYRVISILQHNSSINDVIHQTSEEIICLGFMYHPRKAICYTMTMENWKRAFSLLYAQESPWKQPITAYLKNSRTTNPISYQRTGL